MCVYYPEGIELLSQIGISRSVINQNPLCSLCLCGEDRYICCCGLGKQGTRAHLSSL